LPGLPALLSGVRWPGLISEAPLRCGGTRCSPLIRQGPWAPGSCGPAGEWEGGRDMHTHTHTYRNTHTHTAAGGDMHTHTHTCRGRYAHTHTHTHTQRERERERERESTFQM